MYSVTIDRKIHWHERWAEGFVERVLYMKSMPMMYMNGLDR